MAELSYLCIVFLLKKYYNIGAKFYSSTIRLDFIEAITKDGGILMSKKYCYLFTEADGSYRNLLGGKGANLAEMTKIGLPVPPGLHHQH